MSGAHVLASSIKDASATSALLSASKALEPVRNSLVTVSTLRPQGIVVHARLEPESLVLPTELMRQNVYRPIVLTGIRARLDHWFTVI